MSHTGMKTVMGIWILPGARYIVTMTTAPDKGKPMTCLLYGVENVQSVNGGTSI
jgi:hypothetical protein